MAGKEATQGVENLHYAILTESEDGTVTWAKPIKVSDLQEMSVDVNFSTDKYPMDDVIGDIVNSFEGGTCSIQTYGISNEVLSAWGGHVIDENGVLIKKTDDEPPYIAIGFQAPKRNKTTDFIWLVKCKYKPIKTKYKTQGEKIEPQSSTIDFEIAELKNHKYHEIINSANLNAPKDLATAWFAKVYDGSFT